MKIQLFDGYDLQSLDLDRGISVTWISVPVLRKGIEIKYISKDLYDFLDIPDWADCTSFGETPFVKGITCFLMLSDGKHTTFIRSSEGLYFERDSTLSEKMVKKITEATVSGSAFNTIHLNADFSGDEHFELVPPEQVTEIIQLIKSFRDTVFA